MLFLKWITMTGLLYNVVVRTNLDELPILITASRPQAKRVIANLDEKQIDEAAALMGVDSAGLVNAAIITYRAGRPIKLSLHDLPKSVLGEDGE